MEWYVPIVIFLARIADVSIGTLRTIVMLQGYRLPAALLGSVEVMIWVLAAGWAIKFINEGHWWAIAGYAGGFSTGILVGLWLENKIALGYRMVRIVCTDSEAHAPKHLREAGFRVTTVDGWGEESEVDIAFVVIRRRDLERLRSTLAEVAPGAFVTVERVDRPSGAGFDPPMRSRRMRVLQQQIRK